MPTRSSPLYLTLPAAVLCVLGGVGCRSNAPTLKVDSGREADAPLDPTPDVVVDAGAIDSPDCPASCDDNNPCTVDSCDTTTFRCVNAPVADGTICQGTPCATNSICGGGLCLDGPYRKCSASDQCHVAGLCDPKTGECSNPNRADGVACNDSDKCTLGDRCQNGVCAGDPRVCPDQIRCDQVTGGCLGSAFPEAVSGWMFSNVQWPSSGRGLVRDASGRIFAAGAFNSQTDLGTGALKVTGTSQSGPSYTNVFLAQLDATTDKASWVSSYAGPSSQRQSVTALAAAAKGAPDGTGVIGLIGSLGGGSLTVAGTDILQLRPGDQFIFGASSVDGSGLWGWRLNLQNGDLNTNKGALRAIAGDPRGSSFMVCGNAVCGTGRVAVDGGSYPSPTKDLSSSLNCVGGVDMVLARIDPRNDRDGGSAGTALQDATVWVQQIGGTNDDDCTALAMDAESSTYVLGTYKFGTPPVFANGDNPLPRLAEVGRPADNRMFLAKLDSNNQWVWAKAIGNDGQSIQPDSMFVLGGADVVLAGRISGSLSSFQGADLTSPAFVAKFSGSTGELIWLQGIGAGFGVDAGSGPQSAGVQVVSMTEAGGNILLVGDYDQAYTLGTTPLPLPSGLGAAFVARLDGASGRVKDARGYGDPADTNANRAVAMVGLDDAQGNGANGSILLLNFTGALDFGPPVGALQSVSISSYDSAIVKLAP